MKKESRKLFESKHTGIYKAIIALAFKGEDRYVYFIKAGWFDLQLWSCSVEVWCN